MKFRVVAAPPPSLCRSPCGERGLKSLLMASGSASTASLPVRGAWVEISHILYNFCNVLSLPVRGAWVEITTGVFAMMTGSVAPRAGSVG